MQHLKCHVLLMCLLATCYTQLAAQTDIAIGEWKSHLPYKNVDFVEQSDDKVFLATAESVMIYDKTDGSIEFLSKVEGLSEASIQDMLYDEINNQLIIAYTNSVFDIVTEDDIFSITDIKDKSELQGDKQIYDLYIQNSKFLYLATGFGLVQFDLSSLEFGFTMDVSRKVTAVDGEGDELIIALDDAAYGLNLSETNTPAFFGVWEKLETGLPSNYIPTDVFKSDGYSYVSTSEEVYVSAGDNNFDRLYQSSFEDFNIVFINPAPEGWLLGLRHQSKGQGKLYLFDNANQEVAFADNCFRNIEDASIDKEGRIFTTEIWEGIFYRDSFNGPCKELNVNSPFGREVSDLAIHRDVLIAASGGVRDNFGDDFGRKGVYLKEGLDWNNLNDQTAFIKDNDLLMMYKVAVRPDGKKAYFGSFWAGLVEYDLETQEFVLYDETNTDNALSFAQGDPRVRISGLAFDNDNNLWISNFGAEKPLVVMTNEGVWHSFNSTNSYSNLTDIAVDPSGIVWAAVGGTQGGLLVFDPGESLADPNDDLIRPVNQNNSEIQDNIVNTVKVDNDGSVWVGTGKGAVVFECGGSALDESCTGNLRKVTVDNILANLLASEDVLSIAVDGANRKWFGTRRGIFVQSPDGEEQIVEYNEDNSPLFDNLVRTMEYNAVTGEMFIGTDRGLQSIRTETTGATNFHASQVCAFPNPVHPDYRGPIAIKGLAQDAEVRITDISGMLVHKSNALGGQAIWDGQDLQGNDVAGGVYLVFSSSTEVFNNVDTNVAKILVVR